MCLCRCGTFETCTKSTFSYQHDYYGMLIPVNNVVLLPVAVSAINFAWMNVVYGLSFIGTLQGRWTMKFGKLRLPAKTPCGTELHYLLHLAIALRDLTDPNPAVYFYQRNLTFHLCHWMTNTDHPLTTTCLDKQCKMSSHFVGVHKTCHKHLDLLSLNVCPKDWTLWPCTVNLTI